ncbi:MAG: response regulator [Candidatus Omnitrophica bacterium]|nr:response regulator [Candidatus Omnitrophota bacterium]
MIKVLVVEDEAYMRDNIQKIFQFVGYTTYAAGNAAEAMDIFIKEKPQAIFLDIRLPDKSGIELLKEIKSVDPHNLVFIVSAYKDPDIIKQAMDAGAMDFVIKPFYGAKLRDMLAHNLKRILENKFTKEKPNILIVDDEEMLVTTLSSLLKHQMESNITICFNGTQALQLIQNNPFDIVLLDITLPEMSGLDILKKVKKQCPDTAFFVATGHKSLEVAAQATKLGAAEFIAKPYSVKDVIQKIKMVLFVKGKFIPRPPFG